MTNWAYAVYICTMLNGEPVCEEQPTSVIDNFTSETSCTVFSVISTSLMNQDLKSLNMDKFWLTPTTCHSIQGQPEKFFVY